LHHAAAIPFNGKEGIFTLITPTDILITLMVTPISTLFTSITPHMPSFPFLFLPRAAYFPATTFPPLVPLQFPA
jgi:hypothetical protein